jgi:hypothetical protein
MIHAANPVLDQAPKPFHGIGVNVAFDVHAIGMLDSAVSVLQGDSIVTSQKAGWSQGVDATLACSLSAGV